MAVNDTMAALTAHIKRVIKAERGQYSNHVQATFVAAETTDVTLSHVLVNGIPVHFVRKAQHVGTLSAGQQLICIQGGGIPLTIIAVTTGSINLT